MKPLTRDLVSSVQVIRQGGILAYPTEAVFGLGCDPANLTAVQRLLAIKQRSAHKGLILIAADLNQLTPYLLPLDAVLLARVMPTWPGPVTWLLPVRPEVSPLLRGAHDALAVRITAHPICRQICQSFGGPLVSTSANISDQAPARNAAEVQKMFGQQLDCILDAPLGDRVKPSEIRDGLTGKVLRPA